MLNCFCEGMSLFGILMLFVFSFLLGDQVMLLTCAAVVFFGYYLLAMELLFASDIYNHMIIVLLLMLDSTSCVTRGY